MPVNNIEDKVNLSIDLSFYKQLLQLLSLEQMKSISEFLSEEMYRKMEENSAEGDHSHYKEPMFIVDMMEAWDENMEAEDGDDMSEEEFIKTL